MKMNPCMLISILALLVLRAASECVTHKDCRSAQSLCFDGYCLLATAVPGKCTTSADCRTQLSVMQNAGRGCRNNICYEIITNKLCTGHVSCDDAQVCIRNHCVPSVATSAKCHVGALCAAGQRCLGGICYEPLEPSRVLETDNSR
ncbi:hypothetical protein M514_11481 [Trichuris suis]|uniref:DUF7107 domain-containing protein n=1 Tax=Trichuris suis TaxID=68888 RepID=A0A085NS82_9BILA|nr:hypothetical protein M514_11481 [Trichuris suis]